MNEKEWKSQLEQEGFTGITVCSNDPNAEFPEHTHDDNTVHIILQGEFILTDKSGITVLKKGDRSEFPAGTTHSAKCGSKGCTFIVGIKAS